MASFNAVFTGHFDLSETFANNRGIFRILAVKLRQAVGRYAVTLIFIHLILLFWAR